MVFLYVNIVPSCLPNKPRLRAIANIINDTIIWENIVVKDAFINPPTLLGKWDLPLKYNRK